MSLLPFLLAAAAFLGASAAPTQTPTQVQAPAPAATASVSAEATTLESEADARFARRASSVTQGLADRQETDAAIDLYRKAVAAAPRDMVLLGKLLRALHFRGAYAGASIEEKKVIFEEGRAMGQAAVDRLEAEAKAARGVTRIEALRQVRGAPGLYLWTAGHWGEWALVRGKFAAAKSGLAGRVRDLAQTVIDLDPAFDDGAGYRILGRLHSEAPKIPFITGWVSHSKGVEFLRRSLEAAPNHPVTRYFLAEALLQHQKERRDEAIRLLELSAATPPRPGLALEDARYVQMARTRLDEARRASTR